MRQIVDRSDGVPIFATELAHALLLRDDFDNPAGTKGIPSTLSDILLARLDQLQHGRMTVQQAAVLGREFDMALLVACAKDLMEDTHAAIEELLDAELFVQRNTPNGRPRAPASRPDRSRWHSQLGGGAHPRGAKGRTDDHRGHRREAQHEQPGGFEHRRLVVLHVLRIGQRQALHRHHQRGQAPTIRPEWPRTSSAASGFFFCGMIELPVESASGSATKPNGWLAHRINSSASRERCSAHCAAAIR